MKFDNNVKEYILDDLHESEKYVSIMNTKHNKNFPKIGRKGVDSLLEKLESCSKNVNTCINQESIVTNLQIAKRISYRVKSMSPDYKNSRSPSSRDDTVISPSLSNDDSNDMKQRRKRKLGKPVRLSKESKLIHDNFLQDSKSQIVLKSDCKEYFYNLLPTFVRKKDSKKRVTEKFESYSKEKQLNTFSDNEYDSKEKRVNKMQTEAMEEKFERRSNECDQHKKLGVLNMSKYLLDALKSTTRIKLRRSSETTFDVTNKNSEIRRKSCDNIKELLNESVLKTSVSNYTTTFHEVESQLEKMFAGIIEVDKNVSKLSVLESHKLVEPYSEDKAKCFVHQTLTEETISSSNLNKTKPETKNKRKKLLKMHSGKKLTNIASKISNNKCKNKKKVECQPSMKKKILKKGKDNMSLNEPFNESTLNTGTIKCKGPIIQIKSFKKMLSNIQIVNTPKEDDEEKNKEKRRIFSNGIAGRSGKSNFQTNLDYRGKPSNTGLFNSTLSTRYDADTTDITWICVFCKRGPHCLVPERSSNTSTALCDVQNIPQACIISPTILSDLFGPYLIDSIWTEDLSTTQQDAAITTKTDNKTIPELEDPNFDDQISLKYKKTKIINKINNLYMGMNKLGDDDLRWEVWIHEQCLIWTAGVFITGGRICGLQDAVWDAARSTCNFCSLTGANIGCIKRGCKSVAHYCCALASGWHLDTTHFLPTCNDHDNR